MSEDRKVYAYCRVSTDYQYTENQEMALQAMMEQEEGPVSLLHETVSGRKMKGAKLSWLKELIEDGRVSKVLVYAYDRLGRNVLEGCKFVELCKRNGVKIVSKCEPWDVDTPEGELMFHQTMSMAQYFLGKLSRNTQLGLQRAKARGTFVGGTKGTWIAAKTKAKLARLKNLANKGNTSKDIAKLLEMDERTVARLLKDLANPPSVRERNWDK